MSGCSFGQVGGDGQKKLNKPMTSLTSAGTSLCISVVFAVIYLEAFFNHGKIYWAILLGLHEFLIVFFCREVILAQQFFVTKPENFGVF